jgi:hypothetical protein
MTIFYCLIWDSPNLEGQVPVFISPRNRMAQLYPRALGCLRDCLPVLAIQPPLWPHRKHRVMSVASEQLPLSVFMLEYFSTSSVNKEHSIPIMSRLRSQYSDWLGTGRQRGWSSSPSEVYNLSFFISSRPAMRSTRPPIQRVPEAVSPGVKRRCMKLITHLQLVPRSRQRGYIHPLPHTPSWRSA